MNDGMIMFAAFILGYILLSVFLVWNIYSYLIKREFREHYKLGRISKSIRVGRRRKNAEKGNYYDLNFPVWRYPKKDRTADLRMKNNRIIWFNSFLYVGNYRVFSRKPYDIVNVVNSLRQNGVKIQLTNIEKEKIENLSKKLTIFSYDDHGVLSVSETLRKIVEYYSDNPYGFESLCAELLKRMGFVAEQTPATNDGGYDISLHNEKISAIVECKCYSWENKIGRPAIQKLVGANASQQADRMLFITTSEFSAPAVEYANALDIELIDGIKLMDLLEKYGFVKKNTVTISITRYPLTSADLIPYVPADIFVRYF